MDPNKVLHDLRDLMREASVSDDERVHEWADSFGAMDDWLCRGGFLPTSWNREGVDES